MLSNNEDREVDPFADPVDSANQEPRVGVPGATRLELGRSVALTLGTDSLIVLGIERLLPCGPSAKMT